MASDQTGQKTGDQAGGGNRAGADETPPPGGAAPRVSVIIVNYNGGDRLRRCLEALGRQTFSDFETIVIDNASSDGSVAAAAGAGRAFRLIEAGANLGFAAANNRAAKRARGEWLAFLNPDAYADPDWLAELVAASGRYPWADAFGSTQIDAHTPDRLDGAGDVYHAFGASYRGHYHWPVAALPPEGECFAPCAAAALYRRSVFEALGGFEESFFCYCEDIDLGYRLRLAGGRAVQVADARVLHEGSGVTGKRSDFTVYHGHRNRVWTYYRCTPLALLVATAPFHMMFNLYLLARFSLEGKGRAYLRAMGDAARGLSAQSAARRRLQAGRKADVAAIARATTWSLLKLMRKKADIRPVAASVAASVAAADAS